jgi:DNA-binding transcriptional LysR family regulator
MRSRGVKLLPIVMLTVKRDPADITKALALGLDADVIKTYVELGLGIGILAKMAFNPARDRTLRAIDASHLFESSTTRLGIKRGAYLRRYAYEFIELFAPHLRLTSIEAASTTSLSMPTLLRCRCNQKPSRPAS